MKIFRALVAVGLASVLLVACNGGGEASGPADEGLGDAPQTRAVTTDVMPAVKLLRGISQFDIRPFGNPRALMGNMDVVVVGDVVDVAEGRVEGELDDGPWHNVVVTLEVKRKIKAAPGDITDGRLYLELHRPDEMQVEAFRDVFPPGTQMTVFGFEASDQVMGPVTDEFAGRPEGTRLFAPSPEGFFLGAAGRLVPVYMDQSELRDMGWPNIEDVEDLVAALSEGQ